MKKIFAVILTLAMLLCFVGCVGSDVKATVVNNDGATEYLTAKELAKISDENAIAFKNKYWCASVTVEGTIKEIKSLCTINGTTYQWAVYVEGGSSDWFIGKTSISKTTVTESLLGSLNVGDKVKISGEIVGANSFDCDISNGTTSITKIN